MNDASILSDYEQPSNIAITEHDILASVLHVADKFAGIPTATIQNTLGDSVCDPDQLAAGGLAAAASAGSSQPSSASLKTIHTVEDIQAVIRLNAQRLRSTEAAAAKAETEAIVGQVIEDIFNRSFALAMQNESASIETLMPEHESAQAIPRSTGVLDLHLECSKALLGNEFIGIDAIEAVAEEPSERHLPGIFKPIANLRTLRDRIGNEDITNIIDYADADADTDTEDRYKAVAAEAAALAAKKVYVCDPTAASFFAVGRTESVGEATFKIAESLADGRRRQRKLAKSDSKASTWSRIKRVWSNISGRTGPPMSAN